MFELMQQQWNLSITWHKNQRILTLLISHGVSLDNNVWGETLPHLHPSEFVIG